MENIKLVLCDIDGTLLHDNGYITAETKKAISLLKEKNIMFGIATGRTPYAVKNLIVDWGIEKDVDMIMGFNGGSCYYMKEQTMESCYLLEGQYIQEIMNDFKDFNATYGIYDFKTFHCNRKTDATIKIANANKLSLIIDDLSDYYNKKVEKVLMIETPDKIQQIKNNYERHLKTNHYRIVQSSPILLEFLNPELSKSKGIEQICKRLSISFDNILTFGDELNDLEMIRDCIGVAMGNARKEIKEIAQYITDTNNNDGIANFLYQYILR